MIAVLTGKPPRFPQVTYFIFRPISPKQNRRIISQESPLYGDGAFKTVTTTSDDHETVLSLLKNMWCLTQTLSPNNNPAIPEPVFEPGIPFKSSPQNPNTPLLTLPLLTPCNDPTHNHVLETLLAASVLYTRALSPPHTDFPAPVNEAPFQQLCEAFAKCSHVEFWVEYPGIQLWMLLVGTAAARGKKEAAFWMFYLSRTGNFSDAESWLAGSAAVRTFLEIQRCISIGAG